MTLTAAAKIKLIETALADGKYRTLQKQLRELKDAGRITVRCYLSNSHELLKAEAQRIILELKPIAETQDEIETVEQKNDEVIAFIPTEIVEQKINEVIDSLPPDTIVDNSAFGDRINTGNADEKIWLVKKDGNGKGVTFVKNECGQYYIKLSAAIHSQNVTFVKTGCGQYYETYAGDALRSIVLLGMPIFIWAGVLKTQVAVPDAVRLQKDAQKLDLALHLYDRTSDIDTPQDVINMQKLSVFDNQADTFPVPEDQIDFFDIPKEGLFHYKGRSSWDNCDVMGTIKESETGSPTYLVYGLGEYHLVEEVSFAVIYPVCLQKNAQKQ